MTTDEGYLALPRRIALGMAMAAAMQFGAFVWYASKVDSRLAQLEEADGRLSGRGDERYRMVGTRLEALERDRASDTIRLARLEEQFRWVQDAVGRIERKLDAPRR